MTAKSGFGHLRRSYDRLQEFTATYDSENVFHVNQAVISCHENRGRSDDDK